MEDEREKIEALIEQLRRKTDALTAEVEALRKLSAHSEDRRIDKLFQRRRKPRRSDPQGGVRVR